MTYLKVTDAVNDGINRLIKTLPDSEKAKVKFYPSEDIGLTLCNLANACNVIFVKNPVRAKAIDDVHANDPATWANSLGKLMDVLVEAASNKSVQNNRQTQRPVTRVPVESEKIENTEEK